MDGVKLVRPAVILAASALVGALGACSRDAGSNAADGPYAKEVGEAVRESRRLSD